MEYYEELGLTKNESKAYEALVKHGKLGSSDISRESGVSYSKIYNILNSLVGKGLVVVVPEKSKKFVPSSPDSLIKTIEEKQKKLEQAKQKAIEMKKFYDVKEKNPVVMGIGRKEFYRLLAQTSEAKKSDYSIKWSSEYRDDWAGDTERKIKDKIDIKTLARYGSEVEADLKKWLKIHKNIRKFDNEGVAVSIQDDSEVLISLVKSNVTLLIKDEPFAKIMKKLFLATYEAAEKIK